MEPTKRTRRKHGPAKQRVNSQTNKVIVVCLQNSTKSLQLDGLIDAKSYETKRNLCNKTFSRVSVGSTLNGAFCKFLCKVWNNLNLKKKYFKKQLLRIKWCRNLAIGFRPLPMRTFFHTRSLNGRLVNYWLDWLAHRGVCWTHGSEIYHKYFLLFEQFKISVRTWICFLKNKK